MRTCLPVAFPTRLSLMSRSRPWSRPQCSRPDSLASFDPTLPVKVSFPEVTYRMRKRGKQVTMSVSFVNSLVNPPLWPLPKVPTLLPIAGSFADFGIDFTPVAVSIHGNLGPSLLSLLGQLATEFARNLHSNNPRPAYDDYEIARQANKYKTLFRARCAAAWLRGISSTISSSF